MDKSVKKMLTFGHGEVPTKKDTIKGSVYESLNKSLANNTSFLKGFVNVEAPIKLKSVKGKLIMKTVHQACVESLTQRYSVNPFKTSFININSSGGGLSKILKNNASSKESLPSLNSSKHTKNYDSEGKINSPTRRKLSQ